MEPQDNKKYVQRYDALDMEASEVLQIMEDVRDFILPRRGNFTAKGEKPFTKVKRHALIINDTATVANRMLGAFMQGGLTSHSRPWFKLGLLDRDRAEYGPHKVWLEDAERIMYMVYDQSNFYNVIHTAYEEQGGFATTVCYQEDDPNTISHFTLFTAGEYRLAVGPNGKADTIFRRIWMTAIQMARFFGENSLSNETKNLLNTNPYEWVEVMLVLEPNDGRDITKIDNLNMPYRSVWFELSQSERVLRRSGFNEMPAAVSRWAVVGQNPYGTCPGHDALGNAKMLQEMEKSSLKSIHKENDPPMLVPSELKDILSLLPGAKNVYDGKDEKAVRPLYQIKPQVDRTEAKIERVEQKIQKTFYNDLFLLITDRPNMTAYEVAERQEEKLVLLGPTIERQINELLDPTVERTFNICLRRGLFPPMPEDLEGQKLNVEYVSMLAQAQKAFTSKSIYAYLDMAEKLSVIKAETMDVTNFDNMLRECGEITNVPARIINDEETVQAIRDDRAQIEQQQAELEQAAQGTAVAKELSQTSTEPGNALSDLMEAAA